MIHFAHKWNNFFVSFSYLKDLRKLEKLREANCIISTLFDRLFWQAKMSPVDVIRNFHNRSLVRFTG
jgi:hypothetical protein